MGLFIKERDIEQYLKDKGYTYGKSMSVWAFGITIGLPVPDYSILNFSDSGVSVMGVDSITGKFTGSDLFLNNENIRLIKFRKKILGYRFQLETNMTIDGFENVDLEFDVRRKVIGCKWHVENLQTILSKYRS